MGDLGSKVNLDQWNLFMTIDISSVNNDSGFNSSVGRCVIPCAFLVKMSNIHFLVEKCILFKKKRCLQFLFGDLTSQ